MKTKTMKIINDELYVGSHKISVLAQAYHTPLYVYDEAHIRHKLDTFKQYFQSDLYNCEVVYASKAFLAPYICQIIDEYKMGIDSVSLGDLYLLKKANFPLDKVVMHGNNKSLEELEFCVDNSVDHLVIDNLEELEQLEKITQFIKKPIHVLLRVNPGIEAHTHAYIKTSLLSSKFGESVFDVDKIGQMITICQTSEFITLDGFHAHIGSNINNPKSFIGEAEAMGEFISLIKDKFNYETKVLNLGGGFGIKYLDSDPEINLEEMLQGIINTIDDIVKKNHLALKKLMIEPGRSIVGDAGFTIYTVGGIKNTYGGKKYVFVDGGMTDNIRPALYQAKYTVAIANRMHQEANVAYDVVGKCCESGDIVANDVKLSDVRKGDYLVCYATGAYGYAMASNYNGAPKAAVIFVNGDEVKMAIKRETFDDMLKTNVLITQKVFDTHSDMLYDLYTNKEKGVKSRFDTFHVPQLLNSNVGGSIWTMYSPDDFDLINACKTALAEINIKKLPGFKVILGLEGLRNLKSVEDIEVLYNLGFRHAMLTWNEENNYATGAKADPNHGLKPEGIRLLKKMEELDMIIDLAHLNEKSFFEALAVTNKNIIYSHGNCRTLCDHVRNVTDEQMIALKKVDGLLGLTLASNFISRKEEEQTMDKFIEHLRYAIKFMGIDNVCFGFDFMDYLSDFPNSNLPAVNNASLVHVLIEAMAQAGFTNEEINKICYANFYNRFKDKIIMRG